MHPISVAVLMASWLAWGYPFVFRAPHRQKRPSIAAHGPTLAGLSLQTAAVFIAFAFRLRGGESPGIARILAAALLGAAAAWLSFTAVSHLGRQFRVSAGLYDDHELVRTGPYRLVRHPIYTSMLCMLAGTGLCGPEWQRRSGVF